jgi:biotin carboxyl carrier protein
MVDQELSKLRVDDTEYSTEVPQSSCGTFKGMPDRSKVRAFIPGTIVQLKVRPGDRVDRGSVLLLLDAMKMHNEVCAEMPGRVRSVLVTVGASVQKDQLMVELESL